MSDTNGHNASPKPEWLERLDRLDASHVKLMTDFEVAWAKHEQFVEEQDREWERQQERWRQYDLAAAGRPQARGDARQAHRGPG